MRLATRADTAIFATTIPVTLRTFHIGTVAELERHGYEVLLVSSPGPDLDAAAVATGRAAEALPMSRSISPLADLGAMARWLRILTRYRPSVIYACTPKCALLAMTGGALVRVPRRVYICGGLRLEGETGVRRIILEAMEKMAMGAATEIVVNSRSLYEEVVRGRLARLGKIRQTSPGSSHGVDSNHFRPRAIDVDLMSRLELDPAVPTLGFVGRLTRDKGLDTLLDAVKRLRATGQPVQLLVVGAQDEPDSRTYLSQLQAPDVAAVVVGATTDVRPFFSLMDILVLPSLREGFPNVVLEAAAMAIPTVTTTATGCRDAVIPGETGVLFQTGNGGALAEELKRLLCNDQERSRLGLNARRWVVENFQPQAIAEQIVMPPQGVTQ